MFEAFGFGDRVLKEACWVNEVTFWKPDEERPPERSCATAASRTSRTACRSFRTSMLNQARVHDFYLELMRNVADPARAGLCAPPSSTLAIAAAPATSR